MITCSAENITVSWARNYIQLRTNSESWFKLFLYIVPRLGSRTSIIGERRPLVTWLRIFLTACRPLTECLWMVVGWVLFKSTSCPSTVSQVTMYKQCHISRQKATVNWCPLESRGPEIMEKIFLHATLILIWVQLCFALLSMISFSVV